MAPMTLLSYEDARSWAPMIREQVSKRIMPPWPLDTQVGIQQFKNDRSLSDDEIETIVQWVDAGTPMGDPADEPAAIAWPTWGDNWTYEATFGRPPDVIITSPKYTVKADGMDQWPRLPATEMTSEMGITGDRWVRAVELRPADPRSAQVFHHGSARIANRAPEDVHQGPGSHAVAGNRDQLAEAAVGVRAVELRPADPRSAQVFHHGSARIANRAPEDVHQGPGSHAVAGNRDQLAEAAVGVHAGLDLPGRDGQAPEGRRPGHVQPAPLSSEAAG